MRRGNRSIVATIGGLCLVAALSVVVRARWGSHASLGRPSLPVPATSNRATARQARAAAIRETMETIRAECQRQAGGDWGRWSHQLESLRANLTERIHAAKPYNPKATGYFEARSSVLEGKDAFPLVESAPDQYLLHVVEPSCLDAFRKERPVVAGARWLKQKGIDVLFVAVPKMTEVYAEHFTDPCPSDRIIAPQVRQALLELLEADVEVVDLWYAFQEERDKDTQPLYLPADPHWAPRAHEIAARLIAARLRRYEFVSKAQDSPAFCESARVPYFPVSTGATFQALNPDQQRRAEEVQPRWYLTSKNCKSPQFDDSAPVACIGDSYNGWFMDALSRELNLPIKNLTGGGNTTQAFKEFLRDPELLKDCKVLIWLVCNSSLKNPWPMPPQIRETSDRDD